MGNNLSEMTKKGDKIQVYTADAKLDPNIYRITAFKQSIIELENVETKKFNRVHKTRVAKIIVDDKEVQRTMDKTAKKADPQTTPIQSDPVQPQPVQPTQPVQPAPVVEAEVKSAKPAKLVKKQKVEKVDFVKLAQDGWEIWTKQSGAIGPEEAPIKVASHCMIAKDGLSYNVFNTYNNSLGRKEASKKKNPDGVAYKLVDQAAADAKRKNLEKGGYKKRK